MAAEASAESAKAFKSSASTASAPVSRPAKACCAETTAVAECAAHVTKPTSVLPAPVALRNAMDLNAETTCAGVFAGTVPGSRISARKAFASAFPTVKTKCAVRTAARAVAEIVCSGMSATAVSAALRTVWTNCAGTTVAAVSVETVPGSPKAALRFSSVMQTLSCVNCLLTRIPAARSSAARTAWATFAAPVRVSTAPT